MEMVGPKGTSQGIFEVDLVTGETWYSSGTKSLNRISDWEEDGFKFKPLTPQQVKSTGGPATYYDMPYQDWVTANDQMEYLATTKWKEFSLHMKDIFKAMCRWGDKSGTTLEYDARKIIYSGFRLLKMLKGNKAVQEFLKELTEDKQFKDE